MERKTVKMLAKTASKTQPQAVASKPKSRGRPQRVGKDRPAAAQPALSHRATKSAMVLAALRGDTGASIEELVAATGWQPHSVRGFLSGTVRKRLGLNIVSDKGDGDRRYRIASAAA